MDRSIVNKQKVWLTGFVLVIPLTSIGNTMLSAPVTTRSSQANGLPLPQSTLPHHHKTYQSPKAKHDIISKISDKTIGYKKNVKMSLSSKLVNSQREKDTILPKPANSKPNKVLLPNPSQTIFAIPAPKFTVSPVQSSHQALVKTVQEEINTPDFQSIEIPIQQPAPAETPSAARTTGQQASTNQDLASGASAEAQQNKKSSLADRIKIDGFAQAGGSSGNMRTNPATGDSVEYNIPEKGAVTNRLRFNPNTLAGIQLTGKITDQFNAVIQLVADGDDTNGNKAYRPDVPWAFLRFRLNQNAEWRVGRFRLPLFLYSKTQQVGFTYPWVFLPNEVYRIAPFENINGYESIYSINLGNTGWTGRLESFVGANSNELDLYTRGVVPGAGIAIPQGATARLDENQIYGGAISLSNINFKLRGAYFHTKITGFLPNFVVPGVGSTRLNLFNNAPVSLYSVSAKADYHHVIAIAEYGHRDVPVQLASFSGYYFLIGYHYKQFLPYFTYARIANTNKMRQLEQPFSEFIQSQFSYTLGLDYYLNSHLVAKGSISQINPFDGGNGLFTANPGRRHVYIYGLEIDATF